MTIRALFWRPEDLIPRACAAITRNLSREEGASILYLGIYHRTCVNLPEPPPEAAPPKKK